QADVLQHEEEEGDPSVHDAANRSDVDQCCESSPLLLSLYMSTSMTVTSR
ncbi:hypothetical protein GBF38_004981, partial [Nibea albiflora]